MSLLSLAMPYTISSTELETNRAPKILVRDIGFLRIIYQEVLRKLGDSERERLLLELKVTNWKPEGY
jgi:hypothetical protein